MLQMLLPNYQKLIFRTCQLLVISDPTSVGHILQDAIASSAANVCDGGNAASAAEARGDDNASSAGDVRDGGNASSAAQVRGVTDIISSGINNPTNGGENDPSISSTSAPLCSTDKSPAFTAPLHSSNRKYDRADC
jgi:hypothetical protein